jgi:cardiolipin synthase A/B
VDDDFSGFGVAEAFAGQALDIFWILQGAGRGIEAFGCFHFFRDLAVEFQFGLSQVFVLFNHRQIPENNCEHRRQHQQRQHHPAQLVVDVHARELNTFQRETEAKFGTFHVGQCRATQRGGIKAGENGRSSEGPQKGPEFQPLPGKRGLRLELWQLFFKAKRPYEHSAIEKNNSPEDVAQGFSPRGRRALSMSSGASAEYVWLPTGEQALAEMLTAIDQAVSSVLLEMYIYRESPIGDKFRRALIHATRRGAKVRVLLDAVGAISLSDEYWEAFVQGGGELRWFNPVSLLRFGFRDHRKLLVCDEQVAFIGGYNIAPEYEGDGVTFGWRDLGMKLHGPLVKDCAAGFDESFALAEFKRPALTRWRRRMRSRSVSHSKATLFLSSPGWGRKQLKQAILKDLGSAEEIRIISAYFLPTLRMRRLLMKSARAGRRVQIILAGQSDVVLSQLASRSLYRKFLQAGVAIHEYEPQILHAKLMILDDVVYAGSANLDIRSLFINYELLVRLDRPEIAAQAREIFEADLKHSRRIDLAEWNRSRTFWMKWKERWSYVLLARIDPYIARRQWRLLQQ